MVFLALDRRTVFISCSRDMAAAVPVVVAEIEEINRRLPPGAGFRPYHWARADMARDAGATWQEGIPRPSDPLCALVICLFGERLGEPLPPHFPMPKDIALPEWAVWPPASDAAIPITGTAFEYLDAVHGPRRPPVRCFFKVDGRAFAQVHRDARDRGYGFGHEYDRLREGKPRPPRAVEADYDAQIDRLDAFATHAFRAGGRPSHMFGREGDSPEACLEALRRLLREELPRALGVEREPAKRREPKGLLSYGPDDADILFGRDKAVLRLLDRLRDLAGAPAGRPPLLLLTGRSGEGKSSVLRAGLVGRLRQGLYADSAGPFAAIDITARRLVLAEPLGALAQLAEEALGEGLFEPGVALDDFRPEARLDRLAGALAKRLAERPKVGDLPCRLFLGVDQLDEALALAEEDAAVAVRLRALLAALARLGRDGLLWGALTIPSADLDRLRALAPEADIAVEELRRVGDEDLADIVERSFDAFRLPVGQARAVIADAAGWLEREAGPVLPLVSALMDELVRVAREAQRQRMGPGADAAEPAAPIGIADVLDRLGERAWKQATRGLNFGHDVRLARLLRQLVLTRIGGGEAVALRTCPADHAALRAAPEIVRALLDCRFLFRTADGLRLAHAAILSGWPRAKDWYAADKAHQIALAELEPKAERWLSDRAAGRAGRLVTDPEELDRIEELWFAWKQDADRLPLAFLRACLLACVNTFAASGRFQRTDTGSRFTYAIAVGDDALEQAWFFAADAAGVERRAALLTCRSGGTSAMALAFASAWGRANSVRWLLERGAEVHAQSNSGWTALHEAASPGRSEAVQLLLQAGAAADAKTPIGMTALHLAAIGGHANVVHLLLDRAEIDARDDNQATPLHLAAEKGHQLVVRLLLDRAEIDARDLGQCTPLHRAAQFGHEDVVRLLLEKATIDPRTDGQWTPLQLAASNGHDAVVRLLMDRGEVDARNTGMTALHIAAQNGHEAVVRLLLDKADVNACDDYHWTPLHRASEKGHDSVVRLLLDGAAIDARTVGGWTPIHLAAFAGHEPIVRLLSDRAELDVQNDEQYTPLHLAAQNGHDDVVRLLLLLDRSNIEARTSRQFTPLHLAAQNSHEAVVRRLLGRAEIDARTDGQRTPLHLAAQNGHEAVVRLLLDHAEIDAQSVEHFTSLHIAAAQGHEAVVRLLIDRAEIDARADYQATPLHLAALNGHEAVVRLLLGRAEIDARADGQRTPLHLAAQNGHEAVVRLLLDRAEIDARSVEQFTSLHLAAAQGHEAVVRLLLDRAEIDARADGQWTPLHIAAQNGHVAVVRLLLGRAEIDARADGRRTPLHLAAQNGHEAVVRLLLDHAEIDARSVEHFTSLHLAAAQGHEAVVRLLLDRAEIDARADGQISPLHLAAHNGHDAVVRLLCERADIGAITDQGWTALHAAVEANRPTTVAILLGGRGDPNLAPVGVSALAVALGLGRAGLAQAMIAAGGDTSIAASQIPAFLGDPAQSFDGIVETDTLGLDDPAIAALKDRLREAAPADFASWCAAIRRITAELGGDAATEIARLEALAV